MSDIMFSVAVITYNQEQYISQTLDSILNQEHAYKYEIVVGEDCSTDNTKKIIEEYVEKYPDIIKPLYNNPNKGLINNYFNVINHCQGKYIMECAGDDYWLPGKVKSQIEFMENNLDVGMCYGKARVWNENKQKFERKVFGSDRNSFEYILTNGNDIPALTVCLRRELVKKYINEIKPQEKEWLMEDYPMWLWFYRNTKVKYDDICYGVYRNIIDSLSHANNSDKELKFVMSYIQIQSYFSNSIRDSIKSFIVRYYFCKGNYAEIKKIDAWDLPLLEKIVVYFSRNFLSFVILRFIYHIVKYIKKN